MKLIVGLGNPGRVYANNRHNAGFMCLNHFARRQAIPFAKKQGQARIGVGAVAGSEVVLAKPQTYMNRSGMSVERLVKRFNVQLDELIVIHDDLDLPLGKLRISYGASSSGHKGVDSIIAHLGSRDFIRLRVGIGHPEDDSEADIITYVLGDFTPGEKEVIAPVIPAVSDATLSLLTEGMTAAMNRYN